MTARLIAWVKRQPVLAFYLLAFTLTWLGWAPQAAYSHGLFPFDSPLFYVLGGVGPLAAALIVLSVLRGEWDFETLFAPLLRWRVEAVWYVVALAGSPVIWLAALALSGGLSTDVAKLGPPLGILTSFLIYFVAAIPEEVAWRGFALPRLQRRHSALVSSLIIGVLWALWHLPLLLNQDNVMSTYPLIPYLLEALPLTILYTWLFNSTRGSVFLVTLFHAVSNSLGPYLGVEQTIVVTILALVVVVVFGPAHLSRPGEHRAQADAPEAAAQAG